MVVVRAVARSVPGRHAATADATDDRTPDLDGSAYQPGAGRGNNRSSSGRSGTGRTSPSP